MLNQEILSYIASERQRGVKDSDIQFEMLSKGWNAEDVNSALGVGGESSTPSELAISVSAWSLIKRSYQETIDHFPLILSIVGLPVVLSVAPTILKMSHRSADDTTVILASIAGLVGGALSLLATIGIMKQVRQSWNMDMNTTYSVALPFFWPVIWASVLGFLVVFGGILILIIPGLFVAGLIIISRPAVVLDEKRGLNALMYSAGLVTGYWWWTVSKLLVLGFFCAIPALILSFVPFLSTLTPLLTLPFSAIFIVHLYDTLKTLNPQGLTAVESNKRLFLAFMAIGTVVIVAGIIFALSFLRSSEISNTISPLLHSMRF